MTVKHLQSIQRQHLTAAVASDPSVVHKFKTGFNECASEVSAYIRSLEGIDNGVKQRLILHLTNCLSNLQPLSLPSIPNTTFPAALQNELKIPNLEDDSASRFQAVPGLQLIPSRLPSGELALLLPNSSSLSSLFPSTFDLSSRSHLSAFTPVSKDVAKPSSGSPVKEPEELSKAIESSHSEVSSTSNDATSGGVSAPFKTPTTPSNSQPSGAFSSSSSLLIPVTELSSQYKREQYGFPLSAERTNVLKPLTVYTDPNFDLTSPSSKSSPQTRNKSPLDFSLKKESDESAYVDRGTTRKRPLEDLSCNVPLPPSSKLIKLETASDTEQDTERTFRPIPASAASGSSISGDMWRPW